MFLGNEKLHLLYFKQVPFLPSIWGTHISLCTLLKAVLHSRKSMQLLFFQLIKPNSRLDQKFCQLFFHCDAIVDKLSKLGQISCVISYYMEIKDSLYLSKFFVNVLKNWCTKWERLTLCKIFDGKCEKGTPLTSLSQILQSIFKVTYRNPATIESSKLETIYIFLRSKIWSSVVFWEFGNSTILVTS